MSKPIKVSFKFYVDPYKNTKIIKHLEPGMTIREFLRNEKKDDLTLRMEEVCIVTSKKERGIYSVDASIVDIQSKFKRKCWIALRLVRQESTPRVTYRNTRNNGQENQMPVEAILSDLKPQQEHLFAHNFGASEPSRFISGIPLTHNNDQVESDFSGNPTSDPLMPLRSPTGFHKYVQGPSISLEDTTSTPRRTPLPYSTPPYDEAEVQLIPRFEEYNHANTQFTEIGDDNEDSSIEDGPHQSLPVDFKNILPVKTDCQNVTHVRDSEEYACEQDGERDFWNRFQNLNPSDKQRLKEEWAMTISGPDATDFRRIAPITSTIYRHCSQI